MIDTQGINLLTRRDIVLEDIITILKQLPHIESSKNIYFDLLSCVVDQQIHYRTRGGSVINKIITSLNAELPSADNILTINEKQFSEFKLSSDKYQTVLRLTEFFQEKKLSFIDFENMTESEVRSLLSEIKGIGEWTIDMILLFTLQRPNIFPADDYHLKNLMVQLYGLDPKSKLRSQMLEVAEGWSPYKSLAVQYLLAWKDSKKNPKNKKK